jgi:hypothetical protein
MTVIGYLRDHEVAVPLGVSLRSFGRRTAGRTNCREG